MEALDAFATQVLDAAINYGGYFNKLDFGDKGGVILVLFGAPTAYENNLERATDFLLAVSSQDSAVRWRAGLTFGTVYAGLMGGVERSEYTAIGDVVNLSARLMMQAGWGDLWVAQNVANALRERGYQFLPLGSFSFKGKRGEIAVAQLEGKQRRADYSVLYAGTLIGRDEELGTLLGYLEPIFEGRFGGLVYIYGDAGMGKSRLVFEARQRLEQRHTLKWFACPADDILRQSLNPFRHFLRDYFNQHPEQTLEENRQHFDNVFDTLTAPLEDDELREELQRTRSVLGALVDLHWEESLYEQLDPKLRFENMLSAFKSLILAEAHQQPIVIHVEDLHQLDADSIALLQELSRNIGDVSFVILMTSRYLDDGSAFSIEVDPDIPQNALHLDQLTPSGIAALVSTILGGRVSNALVDFLADKTAGNPFFVEQLVLELREREMLIYDENGIWTLPTRQTLEVPGSINAVLVARLDRLTARVKSVVQTASVLGQEFEVRVLSQMLKGDERVLDKVREGETEAIWQALSEIRYIFKHVLLRDVAYEMQLRARLRDLHRLAATSIEQVFMEDLVPYYGDLAYHFRRAEAASQERYYARLAGEDAAAKFANTEAEAYFSRAFELTEPDDLVTRYELLQAREQVYDLQGARDAQRADLDSLATLAEQMDDNTRRATVALRRASYAVATSAYDESLTAAQQAIAYAQTGGNQSDEAAGHYWAGMAAMRQGAYSTAREQLDLALALARNQGLQQVEADSLRIQGLTSQYEGDFSDAKRFGEEALLIYQASGNRRGESNALINLGNLSYLQGDYSNGQNYYRQALSLYRMIGDRRGQSMAFNNLGGVAFAQGHYTAGRAYCEQALRLNREIGNRQSESRVMANLGLVFNEQGDYDTARGYFEQALQLSQQIGDRNHECWVLRNLGLLFQSLEEYDVAYQYSQQALQIAREIGARAYEGDVLTVLGYALEGLQRYDEALSVYQEAFELHTELGAANLTMEPMAARARVFLAQNNLVQAAQVVDELLGRLETESLDGTEEPIRIYLSCYQVLTANNDERAARVLATGYELLQDRAGKIGDEALRQAFLERVPAHRRLVQIWSEQNPPSE
ncbi:MAG: tetratricopeptide repeat protein [Chloroflexi bacterium]|nr:tetratricopeptide repeat protein [Chloroflexota bacterium]